MECPRCNSAELVFNPETEQNQCPDCGFRLFVDSIEGSRWGGGRLRQRHQDAEKSPIKPLPKPTTARPPVQMDLPKAIAQSALLDVPEITRTRIQGYCQEGLYAIQRGDRPRAIKAFRIAVELQKDFSEAWYMLAGLADNINTQRKCIEQVLAHQPHHAAAQNVLMQINGATSTGQQNQAKSLREAIELQRNAGSAGYCEPLARVELTNGKRP